MVEYRGYCRPLKGKVDFEVEAVNSFDTAKGVKWQVKGTHNDYNISVFTSEGKAKELLTLMAEKNIHEAEDIIITYDMEELIPYPVAAEEEEEDEEEEDESPVLIIEEVEELSDEEAEALEYLNVDINEGEDFQAEGLDPKYLKKDGTPDLRYKASREWVKSQETTEIVEVSVAPHIGLKLDGPTHLLGMVDLWESEGGSVENTSSFEAETKEFVPFIGATRVIPKAVYYQMALNLPQSVSVTPTPKGESIILGFHEQDYSRVEGLIEAYGIPEGGPQEEEKGVGMFQAEEESTLPLPTEWAEDLSNFGAENIPFEAEEFYGEETEVMSLDEYYSNVMDFKDSDTVNVDFAGNVIVKSNEGGIYEGEEFEAPLEPDHLCFTCGNLLQEFTHNCINPSHTHPLYGCLICDDVCSFCDKQTQIESFNSPSREDWLYYCKSCGVQNSLPTTCHDCGSDKVKVVVMASDNLWEPDEGEVAGKYECYCSYCAGVVDLEADACPHCGTVEFKEFDAESFDAEDSVGAWDDGDILEIKLVSPARGELIWTPKNNVYCGFSIGYDGRRRGCLITSDGLRHSLVLKSLSCDRANLTINGRTLAREGGVPVSVKFGNPQKFIRSCAMIENIFNAESFEANGGDSVELIAPKLEYSWETDNSNTEITPSERNHIDKEMKYLAPAEWDARGKSVPDAHYLSIDIERNGDLYTDIEGEWNVDWDAESFEAEGEEFYVVVKKKGQGFANVVLRTFDLEEAIDYAERLLSDGIYEEVEVDCPDAETVVWMNGVWEDAWLELNAESFEAEGCDHDWAITCIKCETRLTEDFGDEI